LIDAPPDERSCKKQALQDRAARWPRTELEQRISKSRKQEGKGTEPPVQPFRDELIR